MADWGAMKDLEPFITWCPARRRRRRRRRKFNLPVAEVCLDRYFVASHCWCSLQIRGIDSHLGRMLALHCQNQRCVRSTFCLKCVDMDFLAEAEMRGRCADRPPRHDNVKIWKPFIITRDSTISATLATQKVHYHMCVVPQTAHPFTQIRLRGLHLLILHQWICLHDSLTSLLQEGSMYPAALWQCEYNMYYIVHSKQNFQTMRRSLLVAPLHVASKVLIAGFAHSLHCIAKECHSTDEKLPDTTL